MSVDPNVLLVIATIVGGFSLASVLGGWAARSWSFMSTLSLLIAIGLFVYVHLMVVPGGLTWRSVPDAFVAVVARILN